MLGQGYAPPRARGGRVNHDSQWLLGIAVAEFNRRGYEGTSMSQVARAAGITKSTIYHHFGSRELLLRAALERALDALFAVLDDDPADGGRAEERLRHLVTRTAATLVAQLPYVTLLLRVRGNTPTELWALQRRREFDRRVTELVAEASRLGEVRADIDPHLATRLIFGMVNSISEWYRTERDASSTQVAEAVASLALDGLRPRLPAASQD
jgi:AcrR family transcriptional regulator